MCNVQHLSPSSIAKYLENKEEFYITYLSEARAPRFAQTQAMSIGSAFDAYVKSFLHEHIFGKANDSRFELKTIFEAQVESHNRDWAWEHGKYAFDCYRRSGALGDLMTELSQAIGAPRFELEIKGTVNGHREGVTKKLDNGVVFLGKPDVFYMNREAMHIELDFKVNGYCSKRPISPMAGYIRIRSGDGVPILTGPHKNCIPMAYKGVMINSADLLEALDIDWARQLTIYAWLCGINIGEDFVCAIDQLACKPGMKYPSIRIAEHRLRVSKDFQWKVFAEAQEIWEVIHSDHYFRELSKEESKEKCEMLEMRAKAYADPATEDQALFNTITRV